LAASEQQITELADAIAAQAHVIARGELVGPRFSAVQRLRENVDTLACWIDDDRV